jgi:hypothetical protein
VAIWPRLIVFVLLLALVVPAAADATQRSSLFGINSWSVLDDDAQLAPLRGTAIGAYRVGFSWRAAQPQAGAPYDFATHDRLVASAARLGVRLLPVLSDSPQWVRGSSSRAGEPPEAGFEMSRFEQFAAAAARRYGVGGSFWASHRDLPYLPIRDWEVWNEPNFPSFWYGGRRPRAVDYRLLLAAARRGLTAGDPRARILFGGLSYGAAPVPPVRYMRAFLRLRGSRCLFDDVAIHPYSRSPAEALGKVRRMRAILDASGRDDARLWLTEYGWSTGGDPGNRFHASEARQRRKLVRMTRALLRERARLRLRGIYWFALRDAESGADDPTWWGWDTGLLRADGSAKPAFESYLRLAAQPMTSEAYRVAAKACWERSASLVRSEHAPQRASSRRLRHRRDRAARRDAWSPGSRVVVRARTRRGR